MAPVNRDRRTSEVRPEARQQEQEPPQAHPGWVYGAYVDGNAAYHSGNVTPC